MNAVEYRRKLREKLPEPHRRLEVLSNVAHAMLRADARYPTEEVGLFATLLDGGQDTIYGLMLAGEFVAMDKQRASILLEAGNDVLASAHDAARLATFPQLLELQVAVKMLAERL